MFIPTALGCFPRSAATPISRHTQKMCLVKRGASSFLTLFQNLDISQSRLSSSEGRIQVKVGLNNAT